jgi:polyhydroxyalkanoate synthesis regulator phasin
MKGFDFMNIKILGMGCSSCLKLYAETEAAVKELNIKAGDICTACGQTIADEFVKNVAVSIDEHNHQVKIKMNKAIVDGNIVKQQILDMEKENTEIEKDPWCPVYGEVIRLFVTARPLSSIPIAYCSTKPAYQ